MTGTIILYNTEDGRTQLRLEVVDGTVWLSQAQNAIMDALTAHGSMSKQALSSETVRHGLRDILLGPAQLYESLRSQRTVPEL